MCRTGHVTGRKERPTTRNELHQDELETEFLQEVNMENIWVLGLQVVTPYNRNVTVKMISTIKYAGHLKTDEHAFPRKL
jgi:hypothetical protein